MLRSLRVSSGPSNSIPGVGCDPKSRERYAETWGKEHIDAMVWLGSRQAAAWFDGASVSQFNVLWANDWMKYAEEMLDSCELLPEERRLLEDGVRVFGVLKDRYDKGF